MSKITDVVSWVMPDDCILKLQNKGETYDIDQKVFDYLKGQNLLETLEDKDVEVEIDETQGQTGVITHLKLASGKTETPKEEPKEEEKKPEVAGGLVVKEITVGGVSVEKSGVVDNETKTWYTLDSTISAQKFKDECTKKVVEITIAPQDKGNDVIKGYILKEEPANTEPEEKTSGKSYKNDMQTSIESQASMNSANRVVQAMVDKDSDPEFVFKLITKIAEHNFKTIQELKAKE